MTKLSKRNYTGQVVYIGMDVHKKTYSVACVCEGEIIKRDNLVASPEKLVAYLQKYFPGATIETAYEAGFSGFHLHRHLKAQGIKKQSSPPSIHRNISQR